MHLLWLRVAAVLYAAAGYAIFPAVLNSSERARRWCVHLGGLAFLFHFVSAVEMLALNHRWVPVGAREAESLFGLLIAGLFFLAWWLYDAISLGLFALHVACAHQFTHDLFGVYLGLFAWGGLWLRDEKLREVFPIRR